MLTGAVPGDEPQPPSAQAGIDPRFDSIVERALERDRERRYQQMREMNVDVTRLARTPTSTIRLAKTIPVPVEKAFAAWTDPTIMTEWYAPTDDFTTPIAEVDLRVGGSYRVGMKPKDRDVVIVGGQYCRIAPPYSLVFTWAWESHDADAPETQVTLEFRPNGDATDLTLIHERFRSEELRKKHTEGWTGCLNRLAAKMGP
jgi:uncharacterized protein YndB with AHSA1/START domain